MLRKLLFIIVSLTMLALISAIAWSQSPLDGMSTLRDFRAMREMGASWKIITEETPQPPGIE